MKQGNKSFNVGEIVCIAADDKGYGMTKYHVDAVFYSKEGGEYMYRLSYKEGHSNSPRTAWCDGLGFKIAPKEK